MAINKDLPMAYLASRYTSHFPIKFIANLIMRYRCYKVTRVLVPCMKKGYVVFGPITHSHSAGMMHDVQTDFSFWLSQDWWYIKRCDVMFVYDYTYGSGSKGVDREIEWCDDLGKEVIYIDKKGNEIFND